MTSPVSGKTAQATIETAPPIEKQTKDDPSAFGNLLNVGAALLKGTASVAAGVMGGPLASAAVNEASKEIANKPTSLKG